MTSDTAQLAGRRFINIICFTINSSSKFATELKAAISSKAYEIVSNNGNV